MLKLKLAAVLVATAWALEPFAAEFGQAIAPATVELQAAAIAEPPTPEVVKQIDAETQAKNWLRKAGRHTGVNSRTLENGLTEETLIAVGTSRQAATASTISGVRSIGAMTATLAAKAEIVQILNTNASAMVSLTSPETGLSTQFDQEIDEMQQKLAELQDELSVALADVDKEKADQVAGLSLEVLMQQGVIAALQARGIDLNSIDVKAESKARLEDLQSRARSLDGQVQDMQKRLAAKKGELKEERRSEIDRLAQMTLTGAVVVNSFESLENGKYTISVVVVWTPQQERFMRSIIGNDASKLTFKPTSGKTLTEYINTIDWSLVSGGRWIVDRDGVPHVFGVSSYDMLNDNPSTMNRAKNMSNLNALHNLVLALKSDVLAHDAAKQKQQTLNDGKGGDQSQVVDSLAREISASVKNMPIQGASPVVSEIYTSPFSGRKMYVTVMEYSPVSRQAAQRAFAKQRDAAINYNLEEQKVRGYINESLDQVKKAATDAGAYAEGRSNAAQDVNRTRSGSPAESLSTEQPVTQGGKLVNRSFGGAGEEDFKF